MAIARVAAAGALVFALGACSPDIVDIGPKASRVLDLPKLPKLGSGAVRKEQPITEADLVAANGYCPPDPDAQLTAAAPPPTAPSTPGGPIDLRSGGPQPAPPPTSPLVFGGIALHMTECQVVRRAGLAQSVDINPDASGQRSVVLTYTQGPWPGIYRFSAGRLVSIDRVAAQPSPKVSRR